MGSDLFLVIQFWVVLFLFGACAFPLTQWLFPKWFDKGYLFSKAVSMATVTFIMYAGGTIGLLPFQNWAILLSLGLVFVLGLLLQKYRPYTQQQGAHNQSLDPSTSGFQDKRLYWVLLIVEEVTFVSLLLFWSWIKGHEASIRSLEKFMDFGFSQVILNQQYLSFGQPTFPAPDIWFAGTHINYYYFGHTTLSILTKLSGVDLVYTFNIILAVLFAFCATMSGSIAAQLMLMKLSRPIADSSPPSGTPKHKSQTTSGKWQESGTTKQIITNHSLIAFERYQKAALATTAAIVTGFLTSLSGNMQTLYAFTRGYTGEDVKPFWNLAWSWSEFIPKLKEGLQTYWYANATRFIPFTIHEFPAYSFVVSDIHGHVLSIPFALLAIAMIIAIFGDEYGIVSGRLSVVGTSGQNTVGKRAFYGFLVAVLFMTNALDGPIYAGIYIFLVLFFEKSTNPHFSLSWTKTKVLSLLPLSVAAFTALPFMVYFKSFVTGLAINCPPSFLTERKIGPFLFETVDKCQKSPLWMWWLLWGFFFFCALWIVVRTVNKGRGKNNTKTLLERFNLNHKITHFEFLLIFIALYCLLLLIFPEFFYFKDIYPAHFRSNTMFKLGYQAFMMLSIISGYAIVSSIRLDRSLLGTVLPKRNILFFLFLAPQLFLVSIYPIFAVRSYFNSLKEYSGLMGTAWFSQQYPDDFAGVMWLKKELHERNLPLKTVQGREFLPVIVEADGDSYTDYERYSVFAGLPTIVGWAVHEWLWRGSYDVVAPKREDVRLIYESTDIQQTRDILGKYGVSYIIVGQLEREKFKSLYESKLTQLGLEVFRQGTTTIYRVL